MVSKTYIKETHVSKLAEMAPAMSLPSGMSQRKVLAPFRSRSRLSSSAMCMLSPNRRERNTDGLRVAEVAIVLVEWGVTNGLLYAVQAGLSESHGSRTTSTILYIPPRTRHHNHHCSP